ncbi:MAG: translocation/assembly module TamB domain-containing protein [Bacteroidota bacterium]|nr:translocation/assembly module TamB domain-containing protein [Bacteroidota bacterium]
MLVIFIVIPATAYFVLQNNNVQTYIIQKVAKTISENLNAKFQVESVNYRFFNKIVLKNVFIEDQQKDSLLFAKEIIANLRRVETEKREIDINNISLLHARLYLHKPDSLAPINLKFIIDHIKRDSTNTKPRWAINIRNIEMHQTVFGFRNYKEVNKSNSINFSELICFIDDLDIRNLTIKNNVVDFNIKNLKFTEQSGFKVYNLKTNMSIGKQHMLFKNIKIRTPNSFIYSDSLSFRHNDFEDYKNFTELVNLDFAFRESNISFNDIQYFSPKLSNIDLNLVVSGRIHGRINSLKGKEVKFHVGEQTELITDFDFIGLPNFNETFIYANFKKFKSVIKDFEIINKFTNGSQKFTIPQNLNNLGVINYEGNFTGFIDDFVTYGNFSTDLGNISTDLSLKPDTSRTLAFDGKLETTDFRVGELITNSETVGKITMNAQIEGVFGRDKTLKANTEGVIQNILVNNYNYQNIILDGYLTEKTYDGILSISDPNIAFDFIGDIDFSTEVPDFNFTANVPKAKLYGLNIDPKDTSAFLSFNVNANFTGINLDNAVGEINFSEMELTKLNETMRFDTLKIIAEQFPDTHKITLKSDYIDAILVGDYQPSTLFQSMKNLFFTYMPALIKSPTDTLTTNSSNNFHLNVDLKDTKLLTYFFLPSIKISDSAKVNLQYLEPQKQLILNALAKKASFNKHTFNQLLIKTISNDSIFTTSTKTKSILLNNQIYLENFKTTSITNQNDIHLKIDWDNKDEKDEYNGKILASTLIKQKKAYDDPSFDITVLPSKIIVQDSIWNINKSSLKIDSTAFTIDNFTINHKNQFLKVNGKISENINDSLFLSFHDIKLSHINILTQNKKLEFDGRINGNASFSSLYQNPLFHSEISVNQLKLNNQKLGYTQIFTTWIEDKKAIKLDAYTQQDDRKNLTISGHYFPVDQTLDFDIQPNQLNLSILNPFLSSFAYDISGKSSGNVKINGTLKKPLFNGNLELNNATMAIDYIKTKYYFTTETKIENNTLLFNRFKILDHLGNQAFTNGYVKFEAQKNILFNFDINTDNILALNTTGIDNENFYGKAFMSGVINISGSNLGNVLVNISGRTERNTKINIPLSKSGSAKESGFVRFINTQKTSEELQDDYNIDLSGFRLNFDLEVTPEAEALLIFDSKIGDIIRARGEGNLKMKIDANNIFNMYGDYSIEEGDYLFTLQNVINKKFEIERGGTILWSGAPYNANIDIEAIYNLRTQLTNLFPEDSSDFYRRRIPVECQIYLSDNLMNPNIRFDINLPTADDEINTRVKSTINTQEKLNKQFLSLLVLNSFMPEQQQGTENYLAESGTSGLGSVTTSELLSNQLSHWLSQISEEWDIGINYRPGDEISRDQVEVALSTQLLNDRVSINGNVGYGGQTTNLVGDFRVDVKLTKNGKLRLKAFNESNDRILYENAPYTQGVGIFYREEFNSFSELMSRFWNNFSSKKKDKEN